MKAKKTGKRSASYSLRRTHKTGDTKKNILENETKLTNQSGNLLKNSTKELTTKPIKVETNILLDSDKIDKSYESFSLNNSRRNPENPGTNASKNQKYGSIKEILAAEDVKKSESSATVESLVTVDKMVMNIKEEYSIQSFSGADITEIERVQTLPRLGTPFFEVIIGQDNLAPFYQLDVPEEMSKVLPDDNVRAFLDYCGKKWKIVYYGSDRPMNTRFNGNWKTFVIDNNLNLNDECLFELMDESSSRCIIFRVQIVKRVLPEIVKEENEAENFDNNVIIID